MAIKPISSVIELIKDTPLIRLNQLYDGPGKLYGKLESTLPGGSVKDRAALFIIQDAYSQKKLISGQTVVEMTSGNMGAGLAVVCNYFHNPFIAVMSAGNSPERVTMLEALGAKVILVKQVDGIPGKVTGQDIQAATAKAIEIAQHENAFYVDQFNNVGSILAHKTHTGPEIWRETAGKIDGFVAAVGSGGTFVGVSTFFKSQNAKIVCVAVEPVGCEPLAGKVVKQPKHVIQGIGYGFIPPHWNPNLCDDIISVNNDEATYYKQQLAHKESLHLGYSSGANVGAAVKLLQSKKLPEEATVVTILCDNGLKYS